MGINYLAERMEKQKIEKAKAHLYSFAKTYVTVLLGIMFFSDKQGVDVLTLAFLVPAMKASLIATLRNVYKLLTEK